MDRDGLSPGELLLVAGAGLILLLAALVWSAGALAAVVAGGRWEASLADAARALFALPAHLGEPAIAWPPSVGPSLPGPLAYWSCTLVVAVLASAGVAGGLRLWGRSRVGTAKRRPLGVEGWARWANRRDLAPLLVRGAEPGRLIIARFGGALVATEDARRSGRRRARQGDRGAVALIGPSRSGKTTAAVSGILEWDGPAVLASVKSDLLAATHGWRDRLGEVAVYDPTGSTRVATACWSPLRGAGTVLGAQRAARGLCDAAPRGGVEGGMDFWLAQAEILLSGLLWVAHHGRRDMGAVCEWVLGQDRPGEGGPGEVQVALNAFRESEDAQVAAAAADVSRTLRSIWDMEERTRSSVFATAQTVVWPWAEPGVARSSKGESIDLEWLLQRGDGKVNTVYLCAPIEDQQRLAPAFGGLLNDLIKQAYLKVAATGKPLDPPLLIVIDEAGNTPLRALPEYASTLAGIGVLMVTIWQSVAQIEAAYRRQADTILTNHLSKVFYAGLSDPASLRYVATVLGEAEIETRSRSNDKRGGRSSTSLSATKVALAPAHALRQMRPGDALLVHATLPPAHVRTRPYYRDRRLAGRSRLTPTQETA